MNCVFCRIVKGELGSDRVYEDEHVIAFRDIKPQAPTHVLVVPKQHLGSLSDLEDPDLASALLLAATSCRPERDASWYQLRERLAHLSLAQGFDELLCLPHVRGIETFWYQVETVRKVLKQFRGRVLLADEVGLGKTIEAGMVLKEYVLRGMAERVLVLVPASLVGQWREELEAKFGLAFATTHDALLRDDPATFWHKDRIIASLATARRREHAEILAARQLDLVIKSWQALNFSRVLVVEHARTHKIAAGSWRQTFEETVVTVYRS